MAIVQLPGWPLQYHWVAEDYHHSVPSFKLIKEGENSAKRAEVRLTVVLRGSFFIPMQELYKI